jgi:phage-related protein
MARQIDSSLKDWLVKAPLLESHSYCSVYLPASENSDTFYFATTPVSINGTVYDRPLKEVGDIKLSGGRAADRLEVILDNSDGLVGGIFLSDRSVLVGAQVVVGRLYRNDRDPGREYTIPMFLGTISSALVLDAEVRLTVISDLYDGNLVGGTRQVSKTCQWKFKGAQCGYAGVEAACNHLLDSAGGCSGRSNQHRYGGFAYSSAQTAAMLGVGSLGAQYQLIAANATPAKQRMSLVFDDGFTATDDPVNNATIISGGGGAVSPDWLNVTKAPYNADLTGATDARAAIKAAIADGLAAAKPVYIPAGTYDLSIEPTTDYCLMVPGGAILIGDGPQQSILKSTANAIILKCPRATNDNGPYAYLGARIERIGVQGSVTAGSSQVGISCTDPLYAQGHYLNDVRISDCGSHGIVIGKTFSSHFEKIFSTNCAGYNFYIDCDQMPVVTLFQCNSGIVRPSAPVGFRIVAGRVSMVGSNGVYGGTGNDWWAVVGKKNGEFGETTNGSAYTNLINCNLESTKVGGILFSSNSYGDFDNCYWAGDAAGTGDYKCILYDIIAQDGQNQDIFYPASAQKGIISDSCVFANDKEFYANEEPIHVQSFPTNYQATPLLQTNGQGPNSSGNKRVGTFWDDSGNRQGHLYRADGNLECDVITGSKTYKLPGVYYISVKAAAAVSIELPYAGNHAKQKEIIIVDGLQNAGTYPITITALSGSGIGESGSYVINKNGGSVILLPNPERNRYEVVAQNSGSDASYNVLDISKAPYNCVGDDATNNTTPLQSAASAAVAAGVPLYIPDGIFLTDGIFLGDMDSLIIRGNGAGRSILKSRVSTSAVIHLDAYQRNTHTITIQDLSIVGYGSGANNHGIWAGSNGSEGFNLNIERVVITNCGGKGVWIGAGWFGVSLKQVHVSQPAGSDDAFDCYGSNDLLLEGCYAHTIGTGKSGYRIHSGAPTFIVCNGIDGGTTANWGTFGNLLAEDGADNYVRATLIGCNVEAFSNIGIHCKSGSTASFIGTQLIAPASGTVKAIKFDYVDANLAGIFDSGSSIQTQGASWADGYAVHSSGMPFLQLGNREITTYYDTGVGGATSLPGLVGHLIAGTSDFALAIDGYGKVTKPLLMPEQSAPATPPANHGWLYAKDVSGTTGLFFKDDAGTERQINAPPPAVALTATQVGFGSGGGVMTGSNFLTWNDSSKILTISSASQNGHFRVTDTNMLCDVRMGTLNYGDAAYDRGIVGTMTNHLFVIYQNRVRPSASAGCGLTSRSPRYGGGAGEGGATAPGGAAPAAPLRGGWAMWPWSGAGDHGSPTRFHGPRSRTAARVRRPPASTTRSVPQGRVRCATRRGCSARYTSRGSSWTQRGVPPSSRAVSA